MVRETSKKAFRDIVNEGWLETHQDEAERVIGLLQPCTARQVTEYLKSEGKKIDGWKCCSQLKTLGRVIEVWEAPCLITGRQAYFLALANGPIKPDKNFRPKKSKLAKAKNLLYAIQPFLNPSDDEQSFLLAEIEAFLEEKKKKKRKAKVKK